MKGLRERFGQEILFHMEFMKNGDGQVIPGAIPLVYFTTEDRLNEMIDFCREIGVFVANPHVNNVEGGGRYRADNVQLLNVVHMRIGDKDADLPAEVDHLVAGL